MKSSFVVKIGGSLLYDEQLQLNKSFLFKLLKWYETAKDEYKHIVMVVGGGRISRHLTSQIEAIAPVTDSLHRIGMATTYVNSQIIKAFLQDDDIYVPHTLGDALEMVVSDEVSVVVTGGYKEGWSTDMDAAVFADVIGAEGFHKLSNIDYVYTGDPKTTPGAIPIEDITWRDYMKQFGLVAGTIEHKPGGHLPVGEFASQFCMNKGLSVRLSGGKRLEGESTLREVFEGGSYIHS